MSKVIKRLSLTTVVLGSLLSQSAIASLDYYMMAVLPSIEAKKRNPGQDELALHAALYPILAPVSELSSCLTSTDALKHCIKDAIGDDASTEALLTPGAHPCTKGDTQGDHGFFRYQYDDVTDTRTFTFSPDCADYGNNKNLHENLIMKSCLVGLSPRVNEGTAPIDGTYRVEYKGQVVCSPDKKTANNYSYRTIGNGNDRSKQQWNYSGTLEFGDGKVALDGSIRGLSRYATGTDTSATPWDDLFLGSDEEWKFENNASLTLGTPIVLDGKASYIKHPNEWEGEKGKGYSKYMAFESLAYHFVQTDRDIVATVTGKVGATCHPLQVEYTTTVDMEDVDSLRDSRGHRMPSSGQMTVANAGYPSNFVDYGVTSGTSGDTAQVTIKTKNTDVNFDNWRSIIAGSSCAKMNDFLDKLPQPPVKNPDAGEILPENIVFAKDLVLSGDKKSVTGKTDGRAVWYHLARDQGYSDGDRVSDLDFDFNVTSELTGAGAGILLNVYLYDENNDPQRVSLYSTADWKQLQLDHPNWEVRTDYMEGDVLNGVLYQGNFILRIGQSTYAGKDETFTINKYELVGGPK